MLCVCVVSQSVSHMSGLQKKERKKKKKSSSQFFDYTELTECQIASLYPIFEQTYKHRFLKHLTNDSKYTNGSHNGDIHHYQIAD